MTIIHRVNNHHPLPRLATPELSRALAEAPVAVLTGARQTGKTTLAGALLAADRPYPTLDALDVQADAQAAPADLGRRPPRPPPRAG